MRRVFVVLALVTAACGAGDAPKEATRDVAVTMQDTRFAPDAIDVEVGETVRFTFTNQGSVDHDAFIGDLDAQAEHEGAMNGGHDHGSGGLTVKPGKTGEVIHTFDEAGSVFVGCHEPGHWDAGMKLTITINEKESNQ